MNIHGTAAKVGASVIQLSNGGKTGTTNDFTDSWYIGFTRQYTMGVWVGFRARSSQHGSGPRRFR